MSRPLPRQIRPHQGETAERFVHRLARANHLRPTYLRECLTQSGGPGPVRLERLATLTGRAPANLTRVFPELAPRQRIPGRTHDAAARKAENDERKQQLFAAIIVDDDAGISHRAIAAKHHVSRQTIRKALDHQTPPPRKKIHRRPPVLHDLAEHIDAMLRAKPAIRTVEIWQRLHDEHDATPSYQAVRAYVSTHRSVTTSSDECGTMPETSQPSPPQRQATAMTEPRIRFAKPGDGAGCAEVWIDMGRYYHQLDPTTFQIPHPAGLADSFEQDIATVDPNKLQLVAETSDTITGLLVARLHEPGPHPEHELLLDLSRPRVFVQILAVAEPHRRSGVGTALMAAAETWAHQHHATTISLDTYLHSPTSVPFYERRMNYHRRAIIFRKDLNPKSED